MFDIETLGVESTTAILSIGIIYFDPEVDDAIGYNELVQRGLMVKLNVKDQMSRLNRTMTKSTLDWWSKQGPMQIQESLKVNPELDILAEDAIIVVKKYINKYMKGKKWDNEIMWARGSLDQMAIDSLTSACGVEPIAPFNRWRDVRTAVDFLTGSTNGYCQVSDLDFNIVEKHHPVHDCALDALMLMRGIPENQD